MPDESELARRYSVSPSPSKAEYFVYHSSNLARVIAFVNRFRSSASSVDEEFFLLFRSRRESRI